MTERPHNHVPDGAHWQDCPGCDDKSSREAIAGVRVRALPGEDQYPTGIRSLRDIAADQARAGLEAGVAVFGAPAGPVWKVARDLPLHLDVRAATPEDAAALVEPLWATIWQAFEAAGDRALDASDPNDPAMESIESVGVGYWYDGDVTVGDQDGNTVLEDV